MLKLVINNLSLLWESEKSMHFALFQYDERDTKNKGAFNYEALRPGATGIFNLGEWVQHMLTRTKAEYPNDTWHHSSVSFKVGLLSYLTRTVGEGELKKIYPRNPVPSDLKTVEIWKTVTIDPSEWGYPKIVELVHVPNKSDTAASTTPAVVTNDQQQENPANAEVTEEKEVIMKNETDGNEKPSAKPLTQDVVIPPAPAPGYTVAREGSTLTVTGLRPDVCEINIELVMGEYRNKQVGKSTYRVLKDDSTAQIIDGKIIIEDIFNKIGLTKPITDDEVVYVSITPIVNKTGKIEQLSTDSDQHVRGVELKKLVKDFPVEVQQPATTVPPTIPPILAPAPVKTAEEMVLEAQNAELNKNISLFHNVPIGHKHDRKTLSDIRWAVVNTIPRALALYVNTDGAKVILEKAAKLAEQVEVVQAQQSDRWLYITKCIMDITTLLSELDSVQGKKQTEFDEEYEAARLTLASCDLPTLKAVNEFSTKLEDMIERITIKIEEVKAAKVTEAAATKAAADKAAAEQAEKLANEEAAKAEAEQKQAEELEKLAAENAAKDEANKALAEQLAHAKADKAQAEAVAQQEREAAEKLRKRVAELEVLKKEVVDEPLPPPPNVSPTAPPASAGGAEGNRVGSGNRSSRLTSWVIGFLIVLTLAQGAWFLLRTKETVEMTVPPLGDEAREEIRQKMLSDTSTNSNMPRLKGVIPNSRQPSTDTAALSQESSLMIGIISEDVKNYGKVTEQTLPLIEALVAQNRVLQVSTNTAASATSGSIKVNESGKNNAGSAGGNGNANGSGTQVIQNNQYHPEYHIYLGPTNVAAPIAAPPTPPPAPKAKEGVKDGKPQCNKHACGSGSTACWVCDDQPSKTLKITSDANSKPGDTKDWSATINPDDSLQIEIASGTVVTFGLSTSSSFEVYLHVNGEYVPWTPESSRSALSDSNIDRARVRLKPGYSAETLYLRAISKS